MKLSKILRRIREKLASPVHSKAFLAFTYFYLIVTAYYLIKPVRSSLVITHLGSEQLPYLYILTAVILGSLVAGYKNLAHRIEPLGLMKGVLWGLVIQLLVFRWAVTTSIGWVSGAFYIWVSMFSVVAVTQFWMVADDLFDSAEAKKMFGFIGAGGIAGGITGGIFASILVRWIQSEDLLIVSAAVLGLSIFLLDYLWKKYHPAFVHSTGNMTVPRELSPPLSLVTYLKDFKALRYLLIMVMVAKGVSTVIDYQFNGLVELSVAGKEARTALFGGFYTALNAVSLVVQLVLTSWLFKKVGVHKTLAVLPVGLALGVIGIFIIPGLIGTAFLALYDRSLSYSIGQAGKEVLYIPIPSEVRFQVKPLIDAAGFRLAHGLAGVALLLTQHLGQIPLQAFGLLALPLAGVWLMAIQSLKKTQPVGVPSWA